MRHVKLLAAPAIALSLILTSGCQTAPSSAVILAPELHSYSRDFQIKLLEERRAIGAPPCDRLEPARPCSAVLRALADYLEVRDDARALTGH